MSDWQLEQRRQKGEHVVDPKETAAKEGALNTLRSLKSILIGDTPSEMAFNAATLGTLPLKAIRPALMGASAMAASDDANAGSLAGVLKRVPSALALAAEKLFQKAPAAASYSDEALAKMLESQGSIRYILPEQFHNATFLMDDITKSETGQLPMLRDLVTKGQINEVPRLTVGKGQHNQYFFIDHDGRHRMQAVGEAYPNQLLPVTLQGDVNIKNLDRISKPVFPQSADREYFDNIDELLDYYGGREQYLKEWDK